MEGGGRGGKECASYNQLKGKRAWVRGSGEHAWEWMGVKWGKRGASRMEITIRQLMCRHLMRFV